MKTLSEEQLALRKAKTLETFKAFIAFCQANQLKYFAAYGTVLGAARHHGFIPWDDDIDVYMMRDDYDRCLSILRNDPPVGYEPVDYTHEEEYYLPFAKFCDKRSTVCEWEEYRISFGNYIDIFPLDAVPDDRTERERYCRRLLKLRGTLAADLLRKPWADILRGATRQSLRLTLADVAYALFRRPIRRWLVGRMERESRAYHGQPLKHVCFSSSYYSREKNLTIDIFGDGTTLPFEDITIVVPTRYEEYLETAYGNWRQLPPVEQRGQHDVVFMDLNRKIPYDEVRKIIEQERRANKATR